MKRRAGFVAACIGTVAVGAFAAELPPPSDPQQAVTIQTITTQSWAPGRWVRVGNQDVWQPGHWETVQTTTTLPSSTTTAQNTAASASLSQPTYQPSVASVQPTWVAERWEQTPDGWNRYAGRWSNQSDVLVERRAIEAPTRTVVVERPVETVIVERPSYSTYSSVSLGVGYGSPWWNVGVGYGYPGYGYWGSSVVVPWACRPHYYSGCSTRYVPSCQAAPHATLSVGSGYVRHH